MNTKFEIVTVIEKLSKEGKKYRLVYALIEIDGRKFMRTFYLW